MNHANAFRDAETLPATRAAHESRRAPTTCRGAPTYLHPGQIATLSGPFEITTIVGACVAVCMWDPLLRTGGMSRILVSWPYSGDRSSAYGHGAVDRLVASLEAMGCVPAGLRARVVGGASVGPGVDHSRRALSSGNVAAAFGALAQHGIAVASQEIGGDRARRLVFRVDNGELAIRPL